MSRSIFSHKLSSLALLLSLFLYIHCLPGPEDPHSKPDDPHSKSDDPHSMPEDSHSPKPGDQHPPRDEYHEERPKKSMPITMSSPHFNVELDYPKAFDVTIESYNGEEGQTGFCTAFPSRVTERVMWSGAIPGINATKSSLMETNNEVIDHDYDNLGYYNKYYFLLDSVTFNIQVTKVLPDKKSYFTIYSDFQNDVEEGLPEDAYMIIDTEMEMLFIVTRKKLVYYDLFEFTDAIKHNKTIPRIKHQVSNFGPYDYLVNVKLYKFRLFVVADNIIDVFLEAMNRTINKEIQFNKDYFGLPTVFLTGIAFKGNYLFVLDKFKGVYLIDISGVDKINEPNPKSRYWFQSNVKLDVANGQFIEVIDNTVQIITTSSKTPLLREYFIIGKSIIKEFEFNRQTELYQSVRDTYADKNYLYLLTGYFNMVAKHAIPGRYQDTVVKDFMTGYWPMFGTKAIVTVPMDGMSKVIALHDDFITIFRVMESNPVLSCNMKGVMEGTHRFKLQAIQKDCAQKNKEQSSDYNTVCKISQTIELIVMKGDANIGHTGKGKKRVVFLGIGVLVLFLLVIVSIWLWRKYKGQYQRLEDEVKFQKLQEEEEQETETGEKGKKRKGSNKFEVELERK